MTLVRHFLSGNLVTGGNRKSAAGGKHSGRPHPLPQAAKHSGGLLLSTVLKRHANSQGLLASHGVAVPSVKAWGANSVKASGDPARGGSVGRHKAI